MSPEPPPPQIDPPPMQLVPQLEALPEAPPPPEVYPFWGYLDLLGFVLIAALGLVVEALLAAAVTALTHVKEIFILLPAQIVLYAFLLGALALIFRRYYGKPFWQSVRWTPAAVKTPAVVTYGILMAFAVMIASVLLKTPDLDSPMKALLSDPTSVIIIAVIGTSLAPICEEILFRGFLQPLLVRSLGVLPGILLGAAAFGLMHLQEYGYSWRHALLISAAGASFGWMRQVSGSTKAAALMHAAYNCVFFLLLAVQQAATHTRWVEHVR